MRWPSLWPTGRSSRFAHRQRRRLPLKSPLKMPHRSESSERRGLYMIGRGGLIAGLLIYVGVTVGCMIFAPAESKTEFQQRPTRTQHVGARPDRVTKLPLRGVAMQLQRIDFTETEYRTSIDEIVDIGADTVMFVVDPRMENGGSSRIYIDVRFTPTPEQLGGLIDYAKSKK